jgi:hypothetical protein
VAVRTEEEIRGALLILWDGCRKSTGQKQKGGYWCGSGGLYDKEGVAQPDWLRMMLA